MIRSLFFLTVLCALAPAAQAAFNPRGTYSGTMAIVDIAVIGSGVTCQGSIGQTAYSEWQVRFRNGVVKVPYGNEVMRGEVLPGKRFRAKKTIQYGNGYTRKITISGKDITAVSGTLTWTTRDTFNGGTQGCVWTWRGVGMTRAR